MDTEIKENISSTTTWGRALFMLLFGLIYSVAEMVLVAVVLLQFCFVLFSGATNDRLLRFGGELSDFLYQIFLYLTFNSEEKPFPFADWPGREDSGDSEADVAEGVITAPHADDTHDSDK